RGAVKFVRKYQRVHVDALLAPDERIPNEEAADEITTQGAIRERSLNGQGSDLDGLHQGSLLALRPPRAATMAEPCKLRAAHEPPENRTIAGGHRGTTRQRGSRGAIGYLARVLSRRSTHAARAPAFSSLLHGLPTSRPISPSRRPTSPGSR